MDTSDLYQTPRNVGSIEDCQFYHVMDLPIYGRVGGEWDLRGAEGSYLGNVDFRGKRVLEVGPASGHLCFFMERNGADVVAFDLSDEGAWDAVPLARYDLTAALRERKAAIRRLNNSFWLAHRAYGSRARLVHGTASSIPDAIGAVDIATFGAVLLHVRDPFGALQQGLRLVRETAVVTEQLLLRHLPVTMLSSVLRPLGLSTAWASFIPRPSSAVYDSWWHLSPECVRAMLRVLGFEKTSTTYHCRARYYGRRALMYTVVGQRCHGSAVDSPADP